MACIDEATAVAAVLTEGQRHDSVPFVEIYAQAAQTGEVRRVIADKAYDGNPIRDFLAAEGVQTTIPSPASRRIKARWLRRHYRQRVDLLVYEKQRQEILKDLSADPYVD